MLDQMKQQRLRSTLPLILAVLPPIFIGLAIYMYGVDAPLWDEWLSGDFLHRLSQGTLSMGNLFAQQNEYRQFFPNLIFVALGWLTNWDVRSWMIASLVLACVVSFCIYHLGRGSLNGNASRVRWTWFIANVIIFSPVQYENWLQGQQLVYFLPIACFTLSLLVASTERVPTGTRFLICALLSVVASFSSVNGMLCWFLLPPVLAFSSSRAELWHKKWWLILWIAAFAGTVAVYFRGYHRPVQHDPYALLRTNPAEILPYYLATLGRSLTPGRMIIAASVGFVLLMLFVWSAMRFVKALRRSTPQARHLLTWLMLGAYSVLTVALLTIGRIEHDATRVVAPSRYTTFTIYLPVALVYLVSINLGKEGQRLRLFGNSVSASRVLSFAAVTLVVIHLAIYTLGVRQMSSSRARALHSKGCSLFANVLDDECLTEDVHPDLGRLKRIINQADHLGFIRPGLVKSNRVQDIAGTQPSGNVGAFQIFTRGEDDTYVASGWAKLPGRAEPADVVLLAYSEGDNPAVIFAIAQVNRERDLVSALIGRGVYGDGRWAKSFSPGRIGLHKARLSAWAFDALSGKAYKLEGEHDFQNQSGSTRTNAHDRFPR